MNDTTPPGPYGLPDWRQASRRFCRPVLSRLCLAASKTHRSPSSRHAPKRRTGFDLYTSSVDDRLFFSGEMFFPLVRLGGSSRAASITDSTRRPKRHPRAPVEAGALAV